MKTTIKLEAEHNEEINLLGPNEVDITVQMEGVGVVQSALLAEAFKKLITAAIDNRDSKLTLAIESQLMEILEYHQEEKEKALQEIRDKHPEVQVVEELLKELFE